MCVFCCQNYKGKEAEATSSEDEVPETQQAQVSHQGCAESGSNRTPSPTVGSKPAKERFTLRYEKAEPKEEEEEDDDDALKYVREIFFT